MYLSEIQQNYYNYISYIDYQLGVQKLIRSSKPHERDKNITLIDWYKTSEVQRKRLCVRRSAANRKIHRQTKVKRTAIETFAETGSSIFNKLPSLCTWSRKWRRHINRGINLHREISSTDVKRFSVDQAIGNAQIYTALTHSEPEAAKN